MYRSFFSFKRFYIIAAIFILFASANSFSIVKPDGGVDLYPVTIGETAKISWDSSNYEGNIDIYLWNYYAGEMQLLDSNVDYRACSYNWSVPVSLTPGNMYRIQIKERMAPYYSEFSSTYFTIYPLQPKVQLSNNDFKNNNRISVFPNPSSNELKLISSDVVQSIIIRNAAGSEVYRANNVNTKETSIKLPELGNGTYFIESTLDNKQVSRDKFVIMK